MIEKKGCTKSVRVIYMIYIIVHGRTDFVHPFFSIISSQSGFIEMNLSQKMFLLVGHKKNVIYSKLVNNPFNERVRAASRLELKCSRIISMYSTQDRQRCQTRCFVAQ